MYHIIYQEWLQILALGGYCILEANTRQNVSVVSSLVAGGRRHCPCRAPPTAYEAHAQITRSKPASLESPPFPSDFPSFRIEFTIVTHETPLRQTNRDPYRPCGRCFPLSGPIRQPCTYSIMRFAAMWFLGVPCSCRHPANHPPLLSNRI